MTPSRKAEMTAPTSFKATLSGSTSKLGNKLIGKKPLKKDPGLGLALKGYYDYYLNTVLESMGEGSRNREDDCFKGFSCFDQIKIGQLTGFGTTRISQMIHRLEKKLETPGDRMQTKQSSDGRTGNRGASNSKLQVPPALGNPFYVQYPKLEGEENGGKALSSAVAGTSLKQQRNFKMKWASNPNQAIKKFPGRKLKKLIMSMRLDDIEKMHQKSNQNQIPTLSRPATQFPTQLARSYLPSFHKPAILRRPASSPRTNLESSKLEDHLLLQTTIPMINNRVNLGGPVQGYCGDPNPSDYQTVGPTHFNFLQDVVEGKYAFVSRPHEIPYNQPSKVGGPSKPKSILSPLADLMTLSSSQLEIRKDSPVSTYQPELNLGLTGGGAKTQILPKSSENGSSWLSFQLNNPTVRERKFQRKNKLPIVEVPESEAVSKSPTQIPATSTVSPPNRPGPDESKIRNEDSLKTAPLPIFKGDSEATTEKHKIVTLLTKDGEIDCILKASSEPGVHDKDEILVIEPPQSVQGTPQNPIILD